MGTLAHNGTQRRGGDPIESRGRYLGRIDDISPSLDVYVDLVSTSLAVRRDRLSKHILRVVAHVRANTGWTLERLLHEADVSKPTYRRWVNGTWTSDLEGSPLERFHDAAGVPVSDAFDILWPGKFGRRTHSVTPPLEIGPEMEVILRALNDPNTSKEDLFLIQATFDMLRDRIATEGRRTRRAQ